jgi:hypothetical protein
MGNLRPKMEESNFRMIGTSLDSFICKRKKIFNIKGFSLAGKGMWSGF